MTTDGQRLASERQLGFEQGEAFDRRLRERELAGREERLSRLLCGTDDPGIEILAGDAGPARAPLGEPDVEREIERLRAFYHAVQNSRAWRLTQRLRGVVGRAW
ncbi:MAG: hypothetical protein JOZ15_18820 [Acidobacteria bacterium]|nr:hypothetical protein [Acidobacteriota bacterium]